MSFNGQLLATGGVAECLTDSVQVFGVDGAYSSNVLVYELNSDGGTTNNVPDATGNYNGTSAGITYSAGKFGNAAVFNRASADVYIDTGYKVPASSTFSFSWWMNANTVPGGFNYYICGDYTAESFNIYHNSSGLGGYGGTDWTTGGAVVSSVTGSWMHFVLVLDGTTMYIYKNGVQAYTASITARSAASAQNLFLGRYGSFNSNTNFNFGGSIDQVRIFTRAISASEATTLYNETNATTSNTNLFNKGAATALYSYDYDASDAGGLYDGTPTNISFGVGGHINTAAGFDGSSSLITITDGGIGANGTARVSFTVSLWVNTIASNQSAIISDYGTNYGFYIQMESSASGGAGKLSIANYYTGGLVYTTAGTAAINDGNWHNLVLVNNTSDNTQKLYIDGNSTPVISQALGTGTKTANAIQVGYYTGYVGTYNFDGSIDQLRLFQTALTTGQIATLFAETACVYTCTTDTVNYPTTNLAYYKLDNSADDETGVYDGTSTDVTYTFGRFNQAAVFNGSSSKISLPNGSFQNTILSVSAWINVSNTSSTRTIIETYGYSGSSKGWLFRLISGKLQFDGYNGDPASTVLTSNESIPLNTWTHVAVVFSANTKGELYINGSEVTYATQTVGTVGYISNEAVNIGTLQGTGVAAQDYFIGSIDQMRIFSSALSDSQITELYNEKPCADTSTFKTVLYEGTGASQYISNVGMDLETNGGLVWLKGLDSARNHRAFDSVRGATKRLYPDLGNAEGTESGLDSFEANGFFLGSVAGNNANNESFVAWNWKAGGDAVAGTGTGVSNVSISANTDAGFSIVKYTGGNSASDTVNHGLTDAEMIILKDLDDGTNQWRAWHKDLTANHWMYLNLTNAEASAATDGGIRNVDANTFGFINGTTGGVEAVNSSSSNYIAYVWKSVAGYSKMGTYTGNNPTKVTVTLGFEPSWIMIKSSSNAYGWWMLDNKRSPTGNWDDYLYANSNIAEGVTGGNWIKPTSTGFETNATGGSVTNANGVDYIYMAFK